MVPAEFCMVVLCAGVPLCGLGKASIQNSTKTKKEIQRPHNNRILPQWSTGARLFRLNSFNLDLRSLIFSSFVLSFRAKTGFIILNCWIHRKRLIRQSSRYLFLTALFFYSEPEVSDYDCVFFGRKPRNLLESIRQSWIYHIFRINSRSIQIVGIIEIRMR